MGRLITLAKEEWPRTAGWLVVGHNCTQLQYDIVCRAMRDIGIVEVPNGSNRGTRLDRYTKRAGLPVPKDPRTKEGWWWCGIWVGCVWADAGALVPQGFPATDDWIEHLVQTAVPGAAILYGLKKPGPKSRLYDAHHIGICARLPELNLGQKLTLTVEGNRAFAGTSNNGIAVDLGPPNRNDILGYIHPVAAAA